MGPAILGERRARAPVTSASHQRAEGLQHPGLRPFPVDGAFVGAHGTQDEMVGARRTHDLQPDRQARLGEAGRHRGGRRPGEIERQCIRRALGPAREGVGIVERLHRRSGGRRHRRQQEIVLLVPQRHVARELGLGLVGFGVIGQRDRQSLLGGAEAGIELAVELRRDLAQARGEAADPQRLEEILQRLDQRTDILDMRAKRLEALGGGGDQLTHFGVGRHVAEVEAQSDLPAAHAIVEADRMVARIDGQRAPVDPRDHTIGLDDGVRGWKIGLSLDFGHVTADPEVRELVAAAAKRFEALGAHVEDVGPLIEPLQNFFEPLWIGSFATRLRQIPTQLHGKLDPGFRAAAEKGLSVTLADYAKAYEAKSKLARDMMLWHQKYDLLLSPVTPTAGPAVETLYNSDAFPRWTKGAPYTLPFNLTGAPAASMPAGLTTAGLPVGLQIVGPARADHLVLRAMRAYESALDWKWPQPRVLETLRTLM